MTSINNIQIIQANAFKALHEQPGMFVIPNPWDAGSARMLANMGFAALATTSAGLAFSLGKPDGEGVVTRNEAIENARAIAAATELPVSADLENGYGDSPESCAEIILLAAGAGLVGASIEDATGRPDDPIYPFELSVERIKAAVEAARSLPFPFTLTARAENLIHGRPDLKDTIRRLEAFANAGADVLFAPGLNSRGEVEAVVKALAPKPVNVVLSAGLAGFGIDELSALGIKRLSLGSAFARAAYGAFLGAAEEIRDKAAFTFAQRTIPYTKINDLLK
ncbi:MAG: isocitrate lyase/phosphoenolpyruvate mutase family protein [Sphingobacteriales bacterium]